MRGALTIEKLREVVNRAGLLVDAYRGLDPFGGLKVIQSTALVIGPFEDWSGVRSRGRAARRRSQGHRQNIRIYYKPSPEFLHDRGTGTIYMHPETYQLLRGRVSEAKLRAGQKPLEPPS